MRASPEPFLNEYIMSLGEESRVKKHGIKKHGFDWIVYQLYLAKGYLPVRLSFNRIPGEPPSPKKETEFGIDQAFVDEARKELHIFVLKAHPLNNRKWTAERFGEDLERAKLVILPKTDIINIESVRIILAYNKDDDSDGKALFDAFARRNVGMFNNLQFTFERWNIDQIVNEVKRHLMKPELLPPEHFAAFRMVYDLCSEVQPFGEEWERLVVPIWRRVLDQVLSEGYTRMKALLVSTMLEVLRTLNESEQSKLHETGWLDLAEWATVVLWDRVQEIPDDKKKAELHMGLVDFTHNYYLQWLFKMLQNLEEHFTHEHGLVWPTGGPGTIIGDSQRALFYLSRIGLISVFLCNAVGDDRYPDFVKAALDMCSLWARSIVRLNPGAVTPLIDSHHIELFLTWFILDDSKERYMWLSELEKRLFLRRVTAQKSDSGRETTTTVPFVCIGNNLELVAEYLSNSESPAEYDYSSSHLLMMLAEMACELAADKRDELLKRIQQRIVQGRTADKEFSEREPIRLLSWLPERNFAQQSLLRDPDSVPATTAWFTDELSAEKLVDFVSWCRENYPWTPPPIPIGVLLLSCLKTRTPIPPELWRVIIWPHEEKADSAVSDS